jgi:excinuclease UvrABC nuclease subunit
MPNIDPAQIDLTALPSLSLAQRQTLPRCAALYFVVEPDNTIVYIGRAVSLQQRWKSHRCVHLYAGQPQMRLVWLAVSDPTLLPGIETACIAFFEPRDNHPRFKPSTVRPHYVLQTVRFPDELLDILRARAQEGDRSLNAEILRTVRQALASHDLPKQGRRHA